MPTPTHSIPSSLHDSPLRPEAPEAGPSSRPYTPYSPIDPIPTRYSGTQHSRQATLDSYRSKTTWGRRLTDFMARERGTMEASPAMSSSYGGTWRRSYATPGRIGGDLENWDVLQELLGDDEAGEGEEVGTEERPRRLARSHRDLRNLFRSREPSRARTSSVPAIGEDQTSSTRLLSSSPPPMEPSSTQANRLLPSLDLPSTIFENGHHQNSKTLGDNADAVNLSSPTEPLMATAVRSAEPAAKPALMAKLWPSSPVAIAVLKCSIAYLLASLFTFVPALAHLLSTTSEVDSHGRISRKPAYSAHMVATIVVYYNPAKSAGNMLLADRFCLILATGATLVCLASILTVHLFDTFSPSQGSKLDWISEMGDWVVCVVWIGGSMGLLAWAKVWVGNPVFNAGCSMAAITIFSVVIKEGNVPKLAEILLIVLSGVLCSNIVCFTILPTSATTRLQKSISKSLTSFSTLLDLLTATFLLQKTAIKGNRTTLREAITAHGKAFKTLKADLAEAKHERLLDPRIRGRKLALYDAAIGSLGRLAQHLSGLRSSTRLQEELIRAAKEGKINLDFTAPEKITASISAEALDLAGSIGPGMDREMDITASVKLFLQFREIAGIQMDELTDRCHDALEAVQSLALKAIDPSVDLDKIRHSLSDSLRQFNQSSSRAIKRLYAGPRRDDELYNELPSEDSSEMEDSEDVDGPNEAVFMIYFFLFTLEEFAREIIFLLETVSEIMSSDSLSTWEQFKSLFVKRGRSQKRKEYLYKQFQQLVPVDPSKLQPPLFPKNHQDVPGTLLTPTWTQLPLWAKIRQTFWNVGSWLREPDKRYAIKVWLAGALLASPAYTEWGRDLFLEFRGEWALIAFFSTMSPTLGQTNHMSFSRTGGTIIGAFFGMLVYSIFPENPVILPIIGFFFAMPCFYVITQMPYYMQSGRFTLLGYNLTCLYAYNKREWDYSVWKIATFRCTTVIIGIIWSAIVSRYWWPVTARRELRMGISDFCLDLSYLYSKLVATYSRGVDPPEPAVQTDENEQEPLLPPGSTRHTHLGPSVRQFLAMELHLHGQLGSLRDLLAQTKNEPRLKGPFAFGFYNEVLLSCERMLDKLHSMRCVTTRDEWDNGIRRAFVAPVNKQRREMAGSVILYYYTLSAGFRLRTPMPPYLPPAEQNRQRLVEAIRNLDVVKRRSVRGGGRHLLFFAYALAMQEVIAELDFMGGMMQEAFGVISQSTVGEFEALFQATPGNIENRVGL